METTGDVVLEALFDQSSKSIIQAAWRVVRMVCEYYVPRSATVMWWTFGVVSLLTGIHYLRYLWATHFLVDMQLMPLAARTMALVLPSVCVSDGGCYNKEAHSVASFYAVVFSHAIVDGFHPGPINCAIILVASLVHIVTIVALTRRTEVLITLISMAFGALIGASKVIFYKRVVIPMCSTRTDAIKTQLQHHSAQNKIQGVSSSMCNAQ